MKFIWASFVMLFLLSFTCYAACTVDLNVINDEEEYEPYDYINLTATGGYPGEGSVIFYIINPQDEEVGRSESIGLNSSGHANSFFRVGNGWAKGTYKIKVDYSKGSCSTSKIVEVYLDTFTVPLTMDIAVNFSLTNISQCQNVSGDNVSYMVCFEGAVPTGFDWSLKEINASQIQEELGNIEVTPERHYYPFEFVKNLQDRMTDAIFQKNEIVDSNTRLSSTVLNQSQFIQQLQTDYNQLADGVLQNQLNYWQSQATQCWNASKISTEEAEREARSGGIFLGLAIGWVVGIIMGILIVIAFIWFRSRGDDLGGYQR